jgi:hypothetical protein
MGRLTAVRSLVALAFLGGACSPNVVVSPSPSVDWVAVTCDAGVAKAAQNVNDVSALDDAIRDCLSMDRLEATLAQHPGFRHPGAATLEEFVEQRCEAEPEADLDDTTICSKIDVHPSETPSSQG